MRCCASTTRPRSWCAPRRRAGWPTRCGTTSRCSSSTRPASRTDDPVRMSAVIDEALLDDPTRLSAGDPGAMLRAVATAGAQVREAVLRTGEADLGPVVAD